MAEAVMYSLDDDAVLKNDENLREACDFIIHDGSGWVSSAVRQNPRPISTFLSQLGDLRDGATIYVKSDMLYGFFAQAFPRIDTRFVLVTAGEDCSTPGVYRCHLDDPRIIQWFGQNCDLPMRHPKFVPIPIGFTDPHHPHGDQVILHRLHRRMPPITDKPLRAHASFQFRPSHPERRRVLEIVRDMPHVDLEPRRIPPELLWIRHANYAFVISPPGNGADCHRTWEALLLRTIPIVRTSWLDPLYDELPVAIIPDWDEITPKAMAAWQAQFKDSFTAPVFARLTRNYWVDRIRMAAGAARQTG